MTCHVGQRGHQIVIQLTLTLDVPLIRTAYRLMIMGIVDVLSRYIQTGSVVAAMYGRFEPSPGKNHDWGNSVGSIRYIALRAKGPAHDGPGGAIIGVIAPVIGIDAKSAPYHRIGIELIRESNARQERCCRHRSESDVRPFALVTPYHMAPGVPVAGFCTVGSNEASFPLTSLQPV